MPNTSTDPQTLRYQITDIDRSSWAEKIQPAVAEQSVGRRPGPPQHSSRTPSKVDAAARSIDEVEATIERVDLALQPVRPIFRDACSDLRQVRGLKAGR